MTMPGMQSTDMQSTGTQSTGTQSMGRRAAPEAFTSSQQDPRTFLAPLDILEGDHARQHAVCELLDQLVRNPRHAAARRELEVVRDYLVCEMPLHVADEEEDLFPLLRRRCPKTDDVGEIFDLLQREHDIDWTLHRALVQNLDALIAGAALADPTQFIANATAFAETQRRHLAWENAVILPRARRHLSAEDQAELGARMAARRGLAMPEEPA